MLKKVRKHFWIRPFIWMRTQVHGDCFVPRPFLHPIFIEAFSSFCVACWQTNKQTDIGENITSLAEVMKQNILLDKNMLDLEMNASISV